MSEIILVKLTGRPPVRINETAWPIVASGEANNSRNGIDRDATRSAELIVRRHADGRALVYGSYDTRWQGEHGSHAGELLEPGADIVEAVRRIGAELWGDGLAQAVLDDLEPEELA